MNAKTAKFIVTDGGDFFPCQTMRRAKQILNKRLRIPMGHERYVKCLSLDPKGDFIIHSIARIEAIP